MASHRDAVERRDVGDGVGAQFGGDALLRLCPVASDAVGKVLLGVLLHASERGCLHIRAVGIEQQAVAVLHIVVGGEDAIHIVVASRLVAVGG